MRGSVEFMFSLCFFVLKINKCKLPLQSHIKADKTNHLQEIAYLLFFLIILNFTSLLQAGKLDENQTQLFGLRNTPKFKT